jgi:hypothetical protein
MTGLGLRLVISGDRETVTRLLVLAAAAGLGVGLLLTTVATTNAVTTWNNRHAWMWTGTSSEPPGPATAATAPLWWHPSGDTFDGQTITRFDVAATATSSPVPPGITHDPGPGQYYASPALAALLRDTPADQLAGRYPGRLAGTIRDAAPSSAAPVRFRQAWSHARSSRPFPPSAGARPGRQRRRSRQTGSPGPCTASTPPRSPGRPRTSRPGGWTPSPWTRSTWRRTAQCHRSNRPGRCWRTHPPIPPPARRPPSAT